ncbi:MAG: leucyl aminopeptidase [Dehalococcoidia bacterium]|nr:leucyl aminopeptidase [Dehalococcoidia bacterium]
MELKVVSGNISEFSADAIMVNIFEGIEYPTGAMAAVDEALDNTITQLINDGEIKGKLNEVTLIHTMGKMPAARIAIIGLGKQQELTLEKVRGATATGCQQLKKIKLEKIATVAHGAGVGQLDNEKVGQSIAEGAILGLYHFNKYLAPDLESREIKELSIVEWDEEKIPSLERGCNRGKIIAEATNFARDMVNEPSNTMTPSRMAETASEMAKVYGLKCTILNKKQISQMGMGALLGVAQGSHQEPKLIVLNYEGDSTSKTALGLVGKGITFDSGGISIKPSKDMWEMKGDMAGAAAVISTMKAIADLKPKINVTALVPATENLPGGGALKPGDILKAMNNKTIEVDNTDAEGRLILADALCYARKLELSPIVDVATLTGACVIALGDKCCGILGNNQELIDKVRQASDDAGECIWQLPMIPEYGEQIKSDVADIKNVGGRAAGTITAAQFLEAFVSGTPWAHIDIAGPSLYRETKTYRIKGATGIAVRTLTNLILTLAEKGD